MTQLFAYVQQKEMFKILKNKYKICTERDNKGTRQLN